ncbi:MAG: hypothetical protein C0623_11500 [Desulfuromonas sp.]|nr:MAG: hypothetical protein C0623_11500 [Desulfuromonas sp.]
MTCENHEKCGFFEKHGDFDLAIFPMLVNIYCRGPLQDQCLRKQYLDETGNFPNDDIAPTGLNFANL